MASIVDICNMALSHLGSRAQITAIAPPDGSVEAGLCARFYPIARKEALESAKWTWCKKRAALGTVTNPSEVWAYAYAVPSDCISPLRILQSTVISDWRFSPVLTADDMQVFTERGSADFEIEGDVLLTNEQDAVLLYARDITDTTKFSATFTSFLSYLLAAYLAGPIVKGKEGAQAALQWRKVAALVRGDAAVDDANGSVERAEHIPGHIRARA